jgi:hypothetical protein
MPPRHWVPILAGFYDAHELRWDYFSSGRHTETPVMVIAVIPRLWKPMIGWLPMQVNHLIEFIFNNREKSSGSVLTDRGRLILGLHALILSNYLE